MQEFICEERIHITEISDTRYQRCPQSAKKFISLEEIMPEKDLMPLSRETLAEQCAEIIYKNIINMKPGYEPGSRLSIKNLARDLGISETPLKIAFKLLESQGVLMIQPRKGTYVAELSKRDIEELLAVRSGIEGLAVQMAKGKFSESRLHKMETCLRQCEFALAHDDSEMYRENDAQFHRLIVGAANNQRLDRLYVYLTASEQIINVYSPRSKDAKEHSTVEHRSLLMKFRSGDERIILAELQRHWNNSTQRVLEGYRQYLKFTNLNLDLQPE